MFKFETKELKPFLTPLLVVALIVIGSLLLLRPRIEIMVKARHDLLKDRRFLADLTQKLSALEGLARVELTEKTGVVLDILPPEKDVPRNLAAIKKLALASGLVVNSINVGNVGEIATVSAKQKSSKTKGGESLPSLSFDVTVTGSLESMKNFINLTQNASPLMKINRLSIGQKNIQTPEAKIEIEAFFLLYPTSLGRTEQPLVAITAAEEKVYSRISNFVSFQSQGELPNLPVGKENLFSP
ncbi:hypothetical protein FJZ41_00795 [Candidatus Shapirobacteria bacterium]|nr:hypothetical protein [Candidatus Shapirobacteria bacterium]